MYAHVGVPHGTPPLAVASAFGVVTPLIPTSRAPRLATPRWDPLNRPRLVSAPAQSLPVAVAHLTPPERAPRARPLADHPSTMRSSPRLRAEATRRELQHIDALDPAFMDGIREQILALENERLRLAGRENELMQQLAAATRY